MTHFNLKDCLVNIFWFYPTAGGAPGPSFEKPCPRGLLEPLPLSQKPKRAPNDTTRLWYEELSVFLRQNVYSYRHLF